ncbi:MAG TPA: sugar ABC transporter substrate-binding protein [Thermoleophilaceae bacterium]
MNGKYTRGVAIAALALAVSVLVAACGGDDDNTSSGAAKTGATPATKSATIGLLLPETKTARYEAHDKPIFQAKVKELCPDCKQLYQNASQDAQKQLAQAEAMLASGADVLVLDAVDVASVGPIIKEANQKNVPVIAYDRLISDEKIAYYVSFDNVRQGRIQAQTLVDKIGKSKPIIQINGAPTDPSAGDYKKGAHQVFDKALSIKKEFDTPDWSPDKAQREMEQAITALGKDGFAGVYSANDGMASGAIAAMKGAGIDPKTRPITGGDAELAAIQRIVAGEQYSTIYLTINKQAEVSAELAVALAQKKPVPSGLVNAKTDNGALQVPSVLLSPVAVTKDNIKDTVVKDGFYKPSEICTGKYAAGCKDAGLM